jgi:hypothetical protein
MTHTLTAGTRLTQAIVVLVVMATFLATSTHAATARSVVSTTPASGEYLSMTTNQVFHFNSTTGLLTPTGKSSNLTAYAQVVGTTCALDCVQFNAHVAITGAHQISWHVVATDVSGFTYAPEDIGPFSGPSSVVTAVNGFSIHEYPGQDGTVVATLKIDGHPVANATASY